MCVCTAVVLGAPLNYGYFFLIVQLILNHIDQCFAQRKPHRIRSSYVDPVAISTLS